MKNGSRMQNRGKLSIVLVPKMAAISPIQTFGWLVVLPQNVGLLGNIPGSLHSMSLSIPQCHNFVIFIGIYLVKIEPSKTQKPNFLRNQNPILKT